MSVNKVILIGNLGRDPELRSFPNGGHIANASLATTEKWKDKQTGERKEHTEWHRLVFSNRQAEVAAQYLRKGSKIYVEGRLRTRKWQGSDGQDKYATEVRVDNMQMLDGRQSNGQGSGQPAQQPAFSQPTFSQPTFSQPAASQHAPFPDMDDDIPF